MTLPIQSQQCSPSYQVLVKYTYVQPKAVYMYFAKTKFSNKNKNPTIKRTWERILMKH